MRYFIAAGVLLAGVVLAWLWFKRRARDQWSRDAMAENHDFKRVVSGQEALTATEADIAGWIERWLSRDPETGISVVRASIAMRLQAVGPRALPHLLRALDDPRCSPDAPPDPGPFLNVTAAVRGYSVPDLVPRARAWSTHRSDKVRERGFGVLAASGREAVAEELLGALTEGTFAESICIGLEAAAKSGTADPRFLSAMSGGVWTGIEIGHGERVGRLYRTLLVLNPDASERLHSAIRVGLRGLYPAIQALNAVRYPVDLERLIAVLKAPVESFVTPTDRELCLSAACKAIGRAGDPAANEHLMKVIADRTLDEQIVREAALAAFFEANGFPKLETVMHWDGGEAPPVGRVIQGAAWLAGRLDQDWLADRIAEYGQWRNAIRIARAVGAPKTLESLRGIGGIMGFDEASEPRKAPRELSDAKRGEIERTARVFVLEEHVHIVVARYALEHAEELRAWKREIGAR
jgi:hypothetical protein